MKAIEQFKAVQAFLLSAKNASSVRFMEAKSAQLDRVLKTVAASAPLSFDEATLINQSISDQLWNSDEHRMLTEAVMSACTDAADGADSGSAGSTRKSATANNRKQCQNYESFVNYFTASEWDCLQSDAMDSGAKLDIILARLAELGLRNPTETCIQLVTALYLVLTEEIKEPTMNHAAMQGVKSKFKAKCSSMNAALVHLVTLPVHVHALPDSIKTGVEDLLDHMVPCRLTLAELQFACKQIPMRVTRSDIKSVGSSPIPQQGMQLLAVPAVQSFVQGMMQQMQNMSASIAALQGNSGAAVQPRLRTLDRVSSRVALALPSTGTAAAQEPKALENVANVAAEVPAEEASAPAEEAPATKSAVQAALAIQACIAERAQHAKDAKASEGGKPKAPAKAKCKAKAKPKAKPTPTKASPAKPSSKRVHSVSESRQLFTEGQAKLGDAWVASKLRADLIASMPETEKKRRRLPPYNKK